MTELPVVLGDGPAPAIAGERSCGACAACCHALAVDGLTPRKPAFQVCPSLRSATIARGRCGVYDSRPGECASYRCLWLQGIIGETRDRPDRSGVVMDVPADLVDHPVWRGIPVLMARIVRSSALREKRTAALITAVARKNVVVLVQPAHDTADGTGVERIIGPTELMDLVRERVSTQSGVRVERVGQELRVARQEGTDGASPH